MLPIKADRIESAEILRGIAAFAVAWFHFTCGNPAFLSEGSLLWLSGSRGYLGVHLFFVISGFVIPYSLSRRKYLFPNDALSFFIRRVVRLEPAYLCSIVLTVGLWALSALIPGSNAILPPIVIFKSMALQIAYLAPWFHVPWILPVYWSLAIEIQYYLFMILLCPLLLSQRPSHVRLFLTATAVLSLSFSDDRLFLMFLPLFGLGFVRFLAAERRLAKFELFGWTCVFAALGVYVIGTPETAAGIFALAVLFIPINRPVFLLSKLGAISYSLYLVHVPVGGKIINFATRLPNVWYVQLSALIIASLITVAAAYVFWRFIEQPTKALSHRMDLGSTKPAAV